MAVWQYRFWLIPLKHLERNPCATIDSLRELPANLWCGVESKEVALILEKIGLPKGDLWDRESIAWGESSSDYVNLILDGNEIEEIAIGIDARNIRSGFVAGLATAMRELQVGYVDEDGRTCAGIYSEIVNNLKMSKSHRFV